MLKAVFLEHSSLRISDIMPPVLVGHQRITGWTELLTSGALKPRSFQVLGFNMAGEGGAVFGLVVAVGTLPQALDTSHHLGLDCRHEFFCIRKSGLLAMKTHKTLKVWAVFGCGADRCDTSVRF